MVLLRRERAFFATSPDDLFITSLSIFHVSPGDFLAIKGHGFLSQNVLHFAKYPGGPNAIYSNTVTNQNGEIDTTISNLPAGVYSVWIENTNGSSFTVSPQDINLSSLSIPRPVITQSYPLNVSQGSKITVKGTGFDLTNNSIHSTLGSINNVPSVNGQLQFSVSDLPGAKSISSSNFPDGMNLTF